MTYSQTIIVGHVGKVGDLRYTPQGVAVMDFSVAVNKVTGKGDNKKTKTTWFKVVCWRERAETNAQYVKKGMKILVEGEVDLEVYTNKSGEAAGQLVIQARETRFLGDSEGGHKSSGSSADDSEPDENGDIPF